MQQNKDRKITDRADEAASSNDKHVCSEIDLKHSIFRISDDGENSPTAYTPVWAGSNCEFGDTLKEIQNIGNGVSHFYER